jgi:hypothetical protein
MLIIREAQMEVFRALTGGSFEDHLVEHLRKSFPHRAGTLDEHGLRHVIRYGMERADNYGFTKRGPSRFYIETMFILGSDFDTDPQYPWAFEVLSDQEIEDEVERADALHARLTEYMGAAVCPGIETRSIRALIDGFEDDLPAENESWEDSSQNNLPGSWDESLEQLLPGSWAENLEDSSEVDSELDPGKEWKDALLARARAIHPEKFLYVGEGPLKTLIADSESLGDYFELADPAGIRLLFDLAYFLGHGVAFDPQFPWVAESLRLPDPAERYRSLLDRSRAFFYYTLNKPEQKKEA